MKGVSVIFVVFVILMIVAIVIFAKLVIDQDFRSWSHFGCLGLADALHPFNILQYLPVPYVNEFRPLATVCNLISG